MTSGPVLFRNFTLSCDGELWKKDLDVLRPVERSRLQSLHFKKYLLVCPLEAIFSSFCIAARCLHLVIHPADEATQISEVRVTQEVLILDKVLDLIPVVSLERFVLELA